MAIVDLGRERRIRRVVEQTLGHLKWSRARSRRELIERWLGAGQYEAIFGDLASTPPPLNDFGTAEHRLKLALARRVAVRDAAARTGREAA